MEKNERGITLLTLAITILIIIILAGVTINATLGDNGLLKQAQDAKDMAESTTSETEQKMDEVLHEYQNIMGGGGTEEPPEDTGPSVPTVTFVSKTTDSITVQANATNTNEDSLTYTLYISTSPSENYTEAATATGNSGSNVNLTASGLSQYTTYYYYVTVTDQIADNQSSTYNQRTYCPGTGHTTSSCTGTTTTTIDCKRCGWKWYL